MIKKSYLLALSLGLGSLLAVSWLLGGRLSARAAPAGELHVCPAGCTYSTLQAAVDAAVSGDVIKVAQGTYSDMHHITALDTATFTATQMVAITKSITLRGGFSTTDWETPDPQANPTILDAGGLGRVMVISGTITPTISGFHLTGGDASGLGGDYWGDVGGALFISGASAHIIDNQIYSNTAPLYGGGMHIMDSQAKISDNVISENSSQQRGGGIHIYRSPVLLSGNTIRDNSTGYRGGGVCSYWSEVTLAGNRFEDNVVAGQGGGLYLYGFGGILNGNIFIGNQATSGGGIEMTYMYGNTPTLLNTALVGNQALEGSGIWFGGHEYSVIDTVSALHTTLYNNSGGGEGIFVGEQASLALTNTIITSHSVGISVTLNSTVAMDTTMWFDNDQDASGITSQINDYYGDPQIGLDGYRIGPQSAARDNGINSGVSMDVDGERRPQGIGYDIGADEFDLEEVFLPMAVENFP